MSIPPDSVPPPTGSSRHVALLRGINVGGRRKLPMAELAGAFAAAGAQDVKTHLQSGNVVFSAPSAALDGVLRQVSDAIEGRYGFRSPITTRTGAEWAQLLGANPFLRTDPDLSMLHVGFLAEAPDESRVAAINPDRSPGDSCVVRGREVYLHLPNGVARTKFSNAYLDKVLGTTSTVRNWRTVLAILELLRADR